MQVLFNGAISEQQFQETQQSSLTEEEAVPGAPFSRSCNNLSSLVRSNVPPLLSIGDCDIMAGSREPGISESSNLSTSLGKSSGTIGFQHSGCTTSTDNELVKRVPSRIINPHVIADSSTGYRVTVPTTTLSGTVQVIDLTSHVSSDTHLKNDVSNSPIFSCRSSPFVSTSQMPKETKNSVSEMSVSNEGTNDFTPIISSSSIPTKGYMNYYCMGLSKYSIAFANNTYIPTSPYKFTCLPTFFIALPKCNAGFNCSNLPNYVARSPN